MIDILEVHVPIAHWFHFITKAAQYVAPLARINERLAEDMQNDMLDNGDEVESGGYLIATFESDGRDHSELLPYINEYAESMGYRTVY